MRLIAILLVLAASITSCSESKPDLSKKKVMVQELHYIYNGYSLLEGTPMQVRYIDTMYHINDTVSLLATTYVVRRD